MKCVIKHDGKKYGYDRINFIKIIDGELIINYQNENDENCEEFNKIPEYLELTDIESRWQSTDKLERVMTKAAEELYPDENFQKHQARVNRCLNALRRYAEVWALEELEKLSFDELFKVRGLGPSSMDLIARTLVIARRNSN